MKPTISLIAAISDNLVLAKNDKLPWHSRLDTAFFRQTVDKHAVIMGSKTYETIKHTKMPDWHAIILSHKPIDTDKEIIVCHTLADAVEKARKIEHNEIFIIGGAHVFKQAMQYADTLYLTILHINVDGDTYFPEDYKEVFPYERSRQHKTEGSINMDFLVLSKTS